MILNKMMSIGVSILFLLTACAIPSAHAQNGPAPPFPEIEHPAFYAESGNWWDISRPGEGLMLERHGNVVSMMLFTFTPNGDPEFYVSSATLKGGPIMVTPPFSVGASNWSYYAEGVLYRFKNGPVFNSPQMFLDGDPPANEYERVGSIRASVMPMTDRLVVWTILDEGRAPGGASFVSRYYYKSLFGYAGFGKYVDADVRTLQASRPCWIDLRGSWVFVDQTSNETRNAWRFNFTELETTPSIRNMRCRSMITSPAISANHTLTYRDKNSGATLRCVAKNIHPFYDENYNPEDHRCVLRTSDGEALLWFSIKDISAKQIIAVLGEPNENHMYWRGRNVYDRITGLRLD